MGDFHEIRKIMTAKEIAKSEGVTVRAINERWKANFHEIQFDCNAPLSPEQVELLSRKKPASAAKQAKAAPRKAPMLSPEQQPATVHPTPAPADEETPASAGPGKKIWVLYLLLIAPTAASVHNMYIVTRDLSGNVWDAVALTVVLSVSALGFVWYGVRAWYTIALAGLLIAYEAFCNLTRIYGGLMGVGQSGNPTRFLGLVTDIFGSGSHCTGIVLGGITAAFLAAVQYAAIFELNKTAKQ